MGRGRAKAKQVKVARQLKYSGGGTDLDRLRAELGVDSDQHGASGDSTYGDLGDRYSGTTTTLITHRMRTTRKRTGDDEDYGDYGAEDLVGQSRSSAGA